MPYRELTMIDIKEVLRRWSARQSLHQIARETGVDRKTARRYVRAAESCSLPQGRELTEGEIHEVAQRVQSRPLPDASAEWLAVAAQKDRIEEWLTKKRPLRLTKVHTLLARDGLEVSYDTLRRFAMQQLGWRQKAPTVRIDDPPPGQEAQVDFGKMGPMLDPATGRMRALWALIITLSFSRYQFVWPTFVQTTEAVCEGLDHAWSFFAAMIRTIVPDNMKAIVKTPDALTPTLVTAFLDYVQARGIFVDPARIRSPKDKPRVENQVPYVRESWFDGETFTSLDDARRSAETWCRNVAGARVHGTTRQVPREVFERSEKAAMLPAPIAPFDVPLWVEQAKVHPDHHIQVARALYSVPSIHRNKIVRARADKASVKIYVGTELVKVHARQPPGGRSTDTSDYPTGKAAYALRSVDALVAKAEGKGHHVGIYAERLLGGPLPWARMRAAYALLRLCEKYGDGRVEAVCQSALAFDVIDVARITRMLKTATKPASPDRTDGKVVQLTLPRFARPEQHFETRLSQKKEGV
ncbi:MAG TPA: IS21 family transposase [Solirubrobacteraceae bacterium]|nr:IS21 family transposase [Solirubrobacteraceae bacterium]